MNCCCLSPTKLSKQTKALNEIDVMIILPKLVVAILWEIMSWDKYVHFQKKCITQNAILIWKEENWYDDCTYLFIRRNLSGLILPWIIFNTCKWSRIESFWSTHFLMRSSNWFLRGDSAFNAVSSRSAFLPLANGSIFSFESSNYMFANYYNIFRKT